MSGEPDADFANLLREADTLYIPIRSFSEWMAGISEITPLWFSFVSVLESERAAAGPIRSAENVQAAMRAAATNTGAIEGLHGAERGLTITVIEQAIGWEAAVEAEEGPAAVGLIAAALEGYEMALDIMTGAEPIHESWIRQLHSTVCAPQTTYRVLTQQGWQEHTLPLGEYKQAPNHVRLSDNTMHAYAPVQDVPIEMHRLVEELKSEVFQSSHPVAQAAYAHHAFTAIHPFADGNGRVARILASVYTLRGASVPLVVLADEKLGYFNALSYADQGFPQPFADFVADHLIGTIGYLVEVLKAGHQSVTSRLDELQRTLTGHGDLTHAEIDLVAGRLADLLRRALYSAFEELELPTGVTRTQMGYPYPTEPLPPQVRPAYGLPSPPSGSVYLANPAPASASVLTRFEVLIAKNTEDHYPFAAPVYRTVQTAVTNSAVDPDVFYARLDEIHPQATSALQMRIDAWAHRLTSEAVAMLTSAAQEALRSEGY